MQATTYHIHWDGQPQPDAVPWTSLDAARYAAIRTIQVDEHYTIVAIGQKGWPHEYKTVFNSRNERERN